MDHGGRAFSRWALLLIAAGFLALLGGVVLLSVLFVQHVGDPEEGPHHPAPLPASSYLTIDPMGLGLQVNGSAQTRWEPAGLELRDGVFTLPWSNGSARLTVKFRGDVPAPVRLGFDATLARTNTYNLSWDPGSGPRLLTPRNGSTFDFLTQETIDRRVSGKFHLDLGEVVLDGKFPLVDKGPNYRGMLSFAFFGGAALFAALGWWRKRRAG